MDLDGEIRNLKDSMMAHFEDDKDNFGAIRSTLETIKDNHLAHMQVAQEKIATDVYWLRWLVMGSAAGVGTIIVGGAIALVSKALS